MFSCSCRGRLLWWRSVKLLSGVRIGDRVCGTACASPKSDMSKEKDKTQQLVLSSPVGAEAAVYQWPLTSGRGAVSDQSSHINTRVRGARGLGLGCGQNRYCKTWTCLRGSTQRPAQSWLFICVACGSRTSQGAPCQEPPIRFWSCSSCSSCPSSERTNLNRQTLDCASWNPLNSFRDNFNEMLFQYFLTLLWMKI
jgi:hypothetical protein